MNSLERFYATVNREPVDRPAAWLGMPDVFARPALYKHYGIEEEGEEGFHKLKLAVGDDFYAVEVPYQAPTASAIYAAFDWYRDGNVDAEDRTLTTPGCFADCEDEEDLEAVNFEWPDPAKYIDPEECRRRVEMAPEGKVALGMMWSAHFQDTCAAFGMENALMNMVAAPEVYEAVDAKIMEFYLKANEIFYEATKGRLNAVLIGNDMGSQRGLMLSPEMVRKFIIPGCKKLVEQAHSYGLKVIYHSCGSIADVIPDLIEAGVDIIHPIQALAAGMEPQGLKDKFGDKVAFCGGVDTQDLLVNGTPEQVQAKVKELRTIFPTGLILSPSHEAILPDIPPANIKALFDEATKIY
ncbi:uroporphyrinogen decarboxylase family protein [Ruminococcus sp. 5_1_39BFAA]|uniref:uroporphyrinogen decarboxylase family protein n=1 Tax=Ruminococcus sp. 5_1_39BFAA TaxID=457412 RepID=UPI003563C9C9